MKKILSSILIGVFILSLGPVHAGKKQTLNLNDVTGGQEIRGVKFDRLINGGVKGAYNKGTNKFTLTAEFIALADPKGDDFYEGWLVREDPFDVVSTGRVTLDTTRKVYTQEFAVDRDLSKHTKYVLTLEPNDGDPAPSEYHILEGALRLRIFSDAPKEKGANVKSIIQEPKSKKIEGIKTPVEKAMLPPEKILLETVSDDPYYNFLKARVSGLSKERRILISERLSAIKKSFVNRPNISSETKKEIENIFSILEKVLAEFN